MFNEIKWKSNDKRLNDKPGSVRDCINNAKKGIDSGEDFTIALEPKGDKLDDWTDWSQLVTILWSRDNNEINELLEELRNGFFIDNTKNSTYLVGPNTEPS